MFLSLSFSLLSPLSKNKLNEIFKKKNIHQDLGVDGVAGPGPAGPTGQERRNPPCDPRGRRREKEAAVVD